MSEARLSGGRLWPKLIKNREKNQYKDKSVINHYNNVRFQSAVMLMLKLNQLKTQPRHSKAIEQQKCFVVW